MFKFEMAVGWINSGTIKIETHDFEIIEILKDFIEFQEAEGWVASYEFSAIDDDDEEETETEDLLDM